MDIPRLLIGLVALGISVILHEIMHGYSALKMGDTTARDDGRLTLNPVPHIDPWMTLILPALLFITTQGRFMFGSAKPVQINALNFRNPSRGMMISAAFGPLTNLALALVGFGILYALHQFLPSLIYTITKDETERILSYEFSYNGFFFAYFVWINLFLMAFNLIPLPPLDGARVLRHFLPTSGKHTLDRIEPYGLVILIPLVLIGATSVMIRPFEILMYRAVHAVFGFEFLVAFHEALWG